MMIPNRDANSDDPMQPPFDPHDKSSKNLYKIEEWLRWRMTDKSLSDEVVWAMHLEVDETQCLAALNRALEEGAGRESLKTLTLRWMKAQAALIRATTASISQRAQSNGH